MSAVKPSVRQRTDGPSIFLLACGRLFRNLGGEQSIVFLLDDPIAFAGAALELYPVEHRDATSAVRNEPGRVQSAGSFGDPLSADA
jgi:hypothetical protein